MTTWKNAPKSTFRTEEGQFDESNFDESSFDEENHNDIWINEQKH